LSPTSRGADLNEGDLGVEELGWIVRAGLPAAADGWLLRIGGLQGPVGEHRHESPALLEQAKILVAVAHPNGRVPAGVLVAVDHDGGYLRAGAALP